MTDKPKCESCGSEEDINICDEDLDLPFCTKCCKQFYSSGECQGMCRQDFIEEDRKEKFLKLFSENKTIFYEMQMNDFGELIDDTAMNHKKTMALCWGQPKLNNYGLDIRFFKDYEKEFRGKRYFLVMFNGKIHAFDMEKVKFGEKIIEAFMDNTATFDYADSKEIFKGILLLRFYSICILISETDSQKALDEESKALSDNLLDSLNFFSLNLRNKLDWTKLDDRIFEELITDILRREETVHNVVLFGGSHDNKRDIVFEEITKTLSKTKVSKVIVQCKHYSNKVTLSDIEDVVKLHDIHKADKYLFVTSNFFTNQAKDAMDSWDKSRNFEVHFWEKEDIELKLEKMPDLVLKYFGHSEKQFMPHSTVDSQIQKDLSSFK